MNIRGSFRGRRLARRLWSRVTRHAAILLYHRVAEDRHDPWSLCVSPRHFAQHLEVLARHHHAVTLAALQSELQQRRMPQRSIVITFDDGYADNLHSALPLLEHWGLPATVFVASWWVGKRRAFWWDDLERLLLRPAALPASLQLYATGGWHRWSLAETSVDLMAERRDRCDQTADPDFRRSLHQSVYDLLRPLPHGERENLLADLRAWARADPDGRSSSRPLDLDELQNMARCELIEVGAHTVHHPQLAGLSATEQQAEIEGSKRFLEDVINQPVRSFAYPFGKPTDYTSETIALTRNAGFTGACSNFPGPVRRTTDCFQLPRFYVTDCDGDEFSRRLSGWLAGEY